LQRTLRFDWCDMLGAMLTKVTARNHKA